MTFARIVLGLLIVTAPAFAAEKKPKSRWLEKLSETLPASDKSADVTGVRGLDESRPSKTTDPLARDYAAIDWLESQHVSEEDLHHFKVEGGLK